MFLGGPVAVWLPIVSGHALGVRGVFLEGSFIRDCLTAFASLERNGVHELSKMVGKC